MATPPSLPERDAAGSSPTSDGRNDGDDSDGRLERAVPGLATSIRAVGFWTAIGMPILYVPLLATGLTSSLDGLLFLGLVVGHSLALYVGHAHRQ